jgi:hypothetical protein
MNKHEIPCEEALPCCPDSDHNSNNTILNCGKGNSLLLPLGGSGGCGCGPKSGPPALVVGTVTLDTVGLHDFVVKVDFSSLINFKATSREGRLFLGIIFQLSKICDGGTKIPLGTWIFEKKADSFDPVAFCCNPEGIAPDHGVVSVNDLAPFNFSWCECHSCPGCCTYILEIIDFDSAFIDFAAITNISFTAMAV